MYDIAEERYTQALVLYQAIDDQVAAAATLNNLGAIAADRVLTHARTISSSRVSPLATAAQATRRANAL
jgi:copper homeostasis protein CutC